jgi:hypothetical protein
MSSISYDTGCEVALPTRFVLCYILERACIAVEPLHGHLDCGCMVVWNCVAFPRCATKGSPWICCYIKLYVTLGVNIFAAVITLRYNSECHTSNIVLIPKSCVGYTFLDKMVTWGKCNFTQVQITPYLEVTNLIFIINFVLISFSVKQFETGFLAQAYSAIRTMTN